MMIAALLALQIEGAPTLEQVRALSPAMAGEQVLRGETHEPIIAVIPVLPRFGPPGVVELDLMERPRLFPEGCVRRRWRATFMQVAAGPHMLRYRHGGEEVALAANGACPTVGYTVLTAPPYPRPTIAAARALTLLRTYRRALDDRRVRFDCRSQVRTTFCGSRREIRAALSNAPLWWIGESSRQAELSLGVGGVTIVRFNPADPRLISVVSTVPGPHFTPPNAEGPPY